MSPMTHENGSVVSRVPSHRTQVPSGVADPTPMSTKDHSDQESSESPTNDNGVRTLVREHLLQKAGPCKSWFKPKFVRQSVGASGTAVGKALTAMYEDEDCDLVVERRTGTTSYVYRVEVPEE